MNMTIELTNLLPEARKRRFRRQYFLRLGTVTLVLLAFVVFLHGVLLYARGEAARAEADLATIKASADTAGEAEVTARQTRLQAAAANLSRLGTVPTASAALRAVLAVSRPGIALTGFTFTAPAAANAPAHMQVTGVAISRDTLRQYSAALGALPFVANADLPISAYAKETDIDFTIALTGTLLP
jgi:Tfp pilus assembly protein PilN